MTRIPPPPNPGEDVTAQMFRDLVEAVRARTPLSAPNARVRETPNGFSLDVAPAAVQAVTSSRNDCFRIGVERISGSDVPAIVNRFYMVGGVIRELSLAGDCAISAYITDDEPAEGSEYAEADKPFVALKVIMDPTAQSQRKASIEGYKTFAAMQAASSNLAYYLKPLFQLAKKGGMKVDFRNAPQVASVEMGS